jgi:DNA-binding MarR family transcriptional regulator
MTKPPALTGQAIGEAAKATNAVLETLLAEVRTSFLSWVALNALATARPVMPQDALVQRMTGGLKVATEPVLATLDELEVAGLVTRSDEAEPSAEPSAEPAVELTADGTAQHRRIRAGIDSIAQRLYGDLPHDDLATTSRILATVTQRANAVLAG